MTSAVRLAFAAALLASSVTLEGVILAGETSVSFSNDVLPVLQSRCVGCHLTGEEEGRLGLAPRSAYGNLVGAPSVESPYLRVKPNAPDESYLLMKLDGTQRDHQGTGARMPLGQPQLDQATRALIKAWIGEGAPDN